MKRLVQNKLEPKRIDLDLLMRILSILSETRGTRQRIWLIVAAISLSSMLMMPIVGNAYAPMAYERNQNPNASERGRGDDNADLVTIPKPKNPKIPDRYIVVLKEEVPSAAAVAEEMAKRHELEIGSKFENAIKGFSAIIPKQALDKVKADPRVKYVEEDQIVEAFDVQKEVFQTLPITIESHNMQPVPTGINRIDADLSSTARINGFDERVNVDIAIIDTGIDRFHPDLNVVRGVTCLGTGFPGGHDDNGHGTHVAGIAGAKDNNIGVVGVAPGAKLWAIKVLNFFGSGSISCVIAGVDYVTANADQIDIANMSLGCECHSNALHEAIKNSVAKGVTYVVAAGNSAKDAMSFEPANYSVAIDGVITVSAIADSDGRCGSLGPATPYGTDDTFAGFSNFGKAVTVAAPGVNILSTFLAGTYMKLSGTSMATPHVTGAAALYMANNIDASPSQVKQALINNAVSQDKQCDVNLNDGNGGFAGDNDGFNESLVYARNL